MLRFHRQQRHVAGLERDVLPVRHVDTGPGANGKQVIEWQTDTSYSADTPANNAVFTVTVPAGFRQIPAPVGSG